MAHTHNLPATDGPSSLRDLVGDDAIATFESSTPSLRDEPFAAGREIPVANAARTAALDEEDEDPEEEELDDEDELEDDDVDEDVDEDDDFEDDEDEDDEDEDEDDEDEEDEDEDEPEAAAFAPRTLHNLAGVEDDDAGDVLPGVNEEEFTDDDMDTDRVAALPYAA